MTRVTCAETLARIKVSFLGCAGTQPKKPRVTPVTGQPRRTAVTRVTQASKTLGDGAESDATPANQTCFQKSVPTSPLSPRARKAQER